MTRVVVAYNPYYHQHGCFGYNNSFIVLLIVRRGTLRPRNILIRALCILVVTIIIINIDIFSFFNKTQNLLCLRGHSWCSTGHS